MSAGYAGPVVDWRDERLSVQEGAAQIAKPYTGWVAIFEEARGVTPRGPQGRVGRTAR
jgi:hypothetical protein